MFPEEKGFYNVLVGPQIVKAITLGVSALGRENPGDLGSDAWPDQGLERGRTSAWVMPYSPKKPYSPKEFQALVTRMAYMGIENKLETSHYYFMYRW